MARKVQILLVDDLDGTDLGANGETVAFGLGGERYEIDLSHANAEKLKNTLGEYVSAARNVTRQKGSAGKPRGAGRSGGRMDRELAMTIRGWARNNGWPKLGERGRIPAEAVDAWHAAGGRNQGQTTIPTPAAGKDKAAEKPTANSTTPEKKAAQDKVSA